MGMVIYLTRFIPNLYEINDPLNKLHGKNINWKTEWTDKQRNAFTNVIAAVYKTN